MAVPEPAQSLPESAKCSTQEEIQVLGHEFFPKFVQFRTVDDSGKGGKPGQAITVAQSFERFWRSDSKG